MTKPIVMASGEEGGDEAAAAGVVAELAEIDALPDAEVETAVRDRECQC